MALLNGHALLPPALKVMGTRAVCGQEDGAERRCSVANETPSSFAADMWSRHDDVARIFDTENGGHGLRIKTTPLSFSQREGQPSVSNCRFDD